MAESRQSEVGIMPDSGRPAETATGERTTPPVIWAGILIVYLLLFVSTGYVAFFVREYNPAIIVEPSVYMSIKDAEHKSLFINTLKQEAETFQKKRELASQSFNVVLGALLGFLSASAVSGFRRRGT
jgi:cytochrome c biogenesis protein CcdA